jgi:hypothetical protein
LRASLIQQAEDRRRVFLLGHMKITIGKNGPRWVLGMSALVVAAYSLAVLIYLLLPRVGVE